MSLKSEFNPFASTMVAQRIKTPYDIIQEKCPQVKVSMRLSVQGYLQISFLKSNLSGEVAQTHFRNGFFKMETIFEVPASLVHFLGLKESRILPGSYKVQEYDDAFLVDFGALQPA